MVDANTTPEQEGTGAASSPVAAHKVGRNDPCPCGSGNKFKKCCINEAAYNTPATAAAAPAKAAAVGAGAGRPAVAKNASFRASSAPQAARTSTKRKV